MRFHNPSASRLFRRLAFISFGIFAVLSPEFLLAQADSVLFAADTNSYAKFGHAVSLGEHLAIAGAPGYDGNKGAAYIFRFNGSQWQQEQKLSAPDPTAGDKFGHAVGISGNTAVVGVPYDDEYGPDAGAVYIYRWNGTTWQGQKLGPSDADRGKCFGYSVAVHNDIVVASTYQNGSAGFDFGGTAYVFRWSEAESSWTQTQQLFAPDAFTNASFGWSCAIHDNVIVVGAVRAGDHRSNIGAVYIYRWDGCFFEFMQKITASDGNDDDRFGVATAIHGNVIAVGANFDSDIAHWAGSAYVFRWNGSYWVEEQKFVDSAAIELRRFGHSVAVFENRLLVGEVFAVQNNQSVGAVFTYRWEGTSWLPTDTLYGGWKNENLGNSVAAWDTFIMAGAPGTHKLPALSVGSAHVYHKGPAAALSVSTERIFAQVEAGKTIVRTIEISNNTDTVVNWTLRTIPNSTWISFDPASGRLEAGESVSATITFDAAGLAAGMHTDEIHVENDLGNEAVRFIGVSLRVLYTSASDCDCKQDCCDEILARLDEIGSSGDAPSQGQGMMLEQLYEIAERLSAVQEKLQQTVIPPSPARSSVPDDPDAEPLPVPELFPVRPNPFNEQCQVHYFVPERTGSASLEVLSLSGALIRRFEILHRGYGHVIVEGGELAAGSYVCRLLADGVVSQSRTMTLLR